jgi:hypothetical protein
VPGEALGALGCPSALGLTVLSRNCYRVATTLLSGGQNPVLGRGVGRHHRYVVTLAGSRSVRQTRKVLNRVQQACAHSWRARASPRKLLSLVRQGRDAECRLRGTGSTAGAIELLHTHQRGVVLLRRICPIRPRAKRSPSNRAPYQLTRSPSGQSPILDEFGDDVSSALAPIRACNALARW